MSFMMHVQPMLFGALGNDSAAPAREFVVRPGQRRAGADDELAVCVLGSGSGGNSTAVRLRRGADERFMLIDAGLGPNTIAPRLRSAGLQLANLRALCVTHLDQDHFRPTWIKTLLGFEITVYLHRWHLWQWHHIDGSAEMQRAGLVHVFEDDAFEPAGFVRAEPVRLPHDDKGTVGFRIDTPGGSLGYATDLGHVPRALIDGFANVDVLAIESNYDPPMQMRSERPAFLKRRIMSGKGHLSNQEAFNAVRAIDQRSGTGFPQHIVLLHRSAQCNDPRVVREVFNQDRAISRRVTLTHQRRRTRWLAVKPVAAMARGQMSFVF